MNAGPDVETYEDLAATAEGYIKKIAALRVSKVDYASEGLKMADARSLRLFQNGLAWRSEELARSALHLMNTGESIAALCLMRAMTETAAACWYVNVTMTEQINNIDPADEAHLKTLRLVMGAKAWDDVPQAVNVLTFLKHAEKTFPGIEKNYALMSEFAHPNWAGTMALYSRRDEPTSTIFERGARTTGERTNGMHVFLASLTLFLAAQEEITKQRTDFNAACELAPHAVPAE